MIDKRHYLTLFVTDAMLYLLSATVLFYMQYCYRMDNLFKPGGLANVSWWLNRVGIAALSSLLIMPGHILVDRLFLRRAEWIVNPRTSKLCGSKRPCGIRKPARVARMLRYCAWGTASVFIFSSAIFLWMITHFGFLGDLEQGHVVDASTPKMPETKCQCSIAKSNDLVGEWLVNLLFTIVAWLFVSRPFWILFSHTLAWFFATCFPKNDDDSDDDTSHELEISDDDNDSDSDGDSDDGKPVKIDIQRAMSGTDAVMLDNPIMAMARMKKTASCAVDGEHGVAAADTGEPVTRAAKSMTLSAAGRAKSSHFDL